MSSIWAHAGYIALALVQLTVAGDICMDGSIPLCSDGSKPQYIGKADNPACPKACNPHNNRCDATAPTCIYPDPKVAEPRGACACRPGYKATGYANTDVVNQWRLPIESHEHRVWVAEGVKCDTLCDVSTGIDSCLEVSLIGAECVGAGTTGRNASQQSMPIFQGGHGNYSQSLAITRTEDAQGAYTQPADPTEDAPEQFAETEFDTDEPAEPMDTGDTDDTGGDWSLDEDASEDSQSAVEDYSMEASDLLQKQEDDGAIPEGEEPPEDLLGDFSEEVDADTEITPQDSEEQPTMNIDETLVNFDEPESADASSLDEIEENPSAEDEPLTPDDSSEPSMEKRSQPGFWPSRAEKKGREVYDQVWEEYVSGFTKVTSVIKTVKHPWLCLQITRSIVDTCKRGVDTQVAFCKKSTKEKVDQCKRNAQAKVDECKRKYKSWDPRKAACEAFHRPKVPACDLKRFDLPFCELDRLTKTCCEGYRPQATVLCAGGISPLTIQKHIQSLQAKCSIGTGLAKAATKSWMTGQVIGVLTQLQSVKEIADTVEAIRKVDQTRADVEKWGDGLAAAAQGNMKEAQEKLGSLIPRISTSAADAMRWIELAKAAVDKNVDALFNKAINAVGEVEAIRSAKSTIQALKTAADDIKAIQAAAKRCARVPRSITPGRFPGWKNVDSQQKLNSAVRAYKELLGTKLKAAAQCEAVVVRTRRLIGLGFH